MTETTAKSETARPKSFKDRYPLDVRQKESKRKIEADPDLLPVIIENHDRSKLPELKAYKFMVSREIKLYAFQLNIRSKFNLRKDEGLYFFIGGSKMDNPNSLMGELYSQSKDEDGFLYITIAELETFG